MRMHKLAALGAGVYHVQHKVVSMSTYHDYPGPGCLSKSCMQLAMHAFDAQDQPHAALEDAMGTCCEGASAQLRLPGLSQLFCSTPSSC